MVISSDILLKGMAWRTAITSLEEIFTTRTNYSIFILSASIGVMYDKRIDSLEEKGEEIAYVPRSVLFQNLEEIDFIFQAAILTTKNETLSEDERLELAFGDEKKIDFEKMKMLIKFANFGVTKIVEKIGNDNLETMENIKNFLASTMEGTNFEIDALDDNLLVAEDFDLEYLNKK
jgi:hypothetical protein